MKKYLTISAGLLAGTAMMLAAAPAMARVNVDLNIGVPGVYVAEPVYVQPQPVYMQPQPVYVQPQPVYYAHPRHYRHRHYSHHRHDRDGDGVPNRYDHRPDNPYRR